MNLWFTPQISEHCRKSIPVGLIKHIIWFGQLGVVSVLILKEGIVQAWIMLMKKLLFRFVLRRGELNE